MSPAVRPVTPLPDPSPGHPRSPGADHAPGWATLSARARLSPAEPLLVALSGGADSVFLLALLAAEPSRPELLAVHVDHGLRGPAAGADALFCEKLCRSLRVPFRLRSLRLARTGPSPEARARRERYRALFEVARATGHTTILTAHHREDALETLCLRWLRGSALDGLAGPQPAFTASVEGRPLRVVRPLLGLDPANMRRWLALRGLSWREDLSNRDPRHARNRVRHALLPWLSRHGGPRAREVLFRLERTVRRLAEQGQPTADQAFSPPGRDGIRRLPIGPLLDVPPAMRSGLLWRLLTRETGLAPRAVLLRQILSDAEHQRTVRRSLPGAWSLRVGPSELCLAPPLTPPRPGSHHQAWLPTGAS